MANSPSAGPVVGGCCLLLCSFGSATAQDATPIDLIVVEGRRAYLGEFSYLEIPQADQLIGEDVLDDAFALSFDQALDLSASAARQNNFGGLWNSFALRGFVGDENLPSNFLVNGFNAGRGFGGPRDMAGIEAVEVLKGPRAALFGRGEPGGTVNLITKQPQFEQDGEIRLTASRYDAFRIDADWSAPLSDSVAIRLVGFAEEAESFRDTVETSRLGFYPSAVWRVGEATELSYELEFSEQEIPFDRGVVSIDGNIEALPVERFLGEPGDGPMQADVLGHQLELSHRLHDDWSLLVGATYRDTSLQGFSTEPELSVSRQQLLVDGRTLTRQRRFRDYDAVYQVFRAELSGQFDTGGLTHRVIAGADIDEFENDQVFLRARAPALSENPTPEQLQAIDVFEPVYGSYPLPEPAPLTDRVETQSSLGFYLQDQISLSDRWDVRIGLRYDDYEQKLFNRAADSRSRQTESRVSPQLGAVFAVTDRLSLYASYGENFRPLSGTDFDGNGFDPNTSSSTEVGAKLLWNDGALVSTVSVFDIDQDNLLVGDPVNAFFLIAAGEATSRGLEIDVSGEISAGLEIWLSYAYVDAEVSNDVLDPNFGLSIDKGDRLLNVPEHTFNLRLARELQLGGRNLRVGGGALYVGDRLGEVGTDFELPDYWLAQVFAEVDLTERLTLRGDIDNLFDENWYANSFSSLWIQPGAPRIWRLSAAFEF